MDIVTLALAKKYVEASLAGAGGLKGEKGLSAYEVAKQNGFIGTESDWLNSLIGPEGATPEIGDNGNWFVKGKDTGVSASPKLSYSSLSDIPTINGTKLNGDLTNSDLGINVMSDNEIDEMFTK